MRSLVALAVVVGTASLSTSAMGQQPWIEDRRYGQGIGVRTGDLELHPSLAGEFGYDSNYLLRAPTERPLDALRLRLTPSLTLSTLGPQRSQDEGRRVGSIVFDGGVYASYNEFFKLDSDAPEDLSSERDVNLGLGIDLQVLPQKPWSFDVVANYERRVEPSNDPGALSAFDRNTIRLGPGVTFRPGGGLFEWRLGYELRYVFFESPFFQIYNNADQRIETRGRWRFFPRTALIYDAYYRFIRYNQIAQADGDMIRARLGLNGLVTSRLALLGMAGWAASYYEPEISSSGPVSEQNFDGPVATLEGKWYLNPQPKLQEGDAAIGVSTVALGYDRGYENSYLGTFYRRDRIYSELSYFFAGRAVVALRASYDHISYPNFVLRDVAEPGFSENRIGLRAFSEYRFSNTWGVNATLEYTQNVSNVLTVDQAIPPDSPTDIPGCPAGAVCDDLDFKRFQAYVGARWFM